MATMESLSHTQETTEEFGERLLGVINASGLSMMLSIGHRTGLWDAMSQMDPATSTEIAARTGLQERYVREWLGAMVTGKVVDYDAATQQYWLPAHRAALLTRAGAPSNMAATMQWISVLGSVEDEVVERFQQGGGVHYCRFKRFHEVMAEESNQSTVGGLFEHILPLVDGLQARLEEGIEVLDVGCGRGRAMIALAERFPHSQFTGYDFSEEAIEAATREAAAKNLANIRFAVRDAAKIDDHRQYDLITAFDAIHDQARPDLVLANIARALLDGGVFLMQDITASSYVEKNIDHPLGPFLYTISTMHCMTVSLASGGMGLGTAWGEELACKMLKNAGFSLPEVKRLPHDIMNSYYIVRLAE
ncbi:Methyltransferase type 11 [Pirellula staleyi DSM 6068]|uniref:Methyltransferase type 11 n=1 Tax=Pirellula staleyi (strain ATCC 27377 / DSM 6068 / ICPB 4128) TaxID=530564 RepID=D2QWT2_PIRSD|nr:class I SAM-dependent methyltransferase [Pirellula staleyi]ADB16036.1 Methyltransferase type 11 [Pirellula staleyi DSM 6068]